MIDSMVQDLARPRKWDKQKPKNIMDVETRFYFEMDHLSLLALLKNSRAR